jgi:hypothetical protein
MSTLSRIGVFVFFAVVIAAANSKTSPDSTGGTSQAQAEYIRLPLAFEANEGQLDREARFLARGEGYAVFLTRNEAVLTMQGAEKLKRAGVLRLSWVNGNRIPKISGEQKLPGKINYLRGNDPAKWRTNVPTFGRIRYRQIYPGIDLVFYGNQRKLEYDFVVAPGADPKQIALAVDGAKSLRVSKTGDLLIDLGDTEIIQHLPKIYQERNGRRQTVRGEYVILSDNRVGFELGSYDRRRALVIDPTISYSSYLGGSGFDAASTIAVSSGGGAFVTGWTQSSDFPRRNAPQVTLQGAQDAFVAKFWSSGGGLIYSTYIGGSSFDTGSGIAVDRFGNAYVAGSTSSFDFPTTAGAYQTQHHSHPRIAMLLL